MTKPAFTGKDQELFDAVKDNSIVIVIKKIQEYGFSDILHKEAFNEGLKARGDILPIKMLIDELGHSWEMMGGDKKWHGNKYQVNSSPVSEFMAALLKSGNTQGARELIDFSLQKRKLSLKDRAIKLYQDKMGPDGVDGIKNILWEAVKNKEQMELFFEFNLDRFLDKTFIAAVAGISKNLESMVFVLQEKGYEKYITKPSRSNILLNIAADKSEGSYERALFLINECGIKEHAQEDEKDSGVISNAFMNATLNDNVQIACFLCEDPQLRQCIDPHVNQDGPYSNAVILRNNRILDLMEKLPNKKRDFVYFLNDYSVKKIDEESIRNAIMRRDGDVNKIFIPSPAKKTGLTYQDYMGRSQEDEIKMDEALKTIKSVIKEKDEIDSLRKTLVEGSNVNKKNPQARYAI